MAKARAQAEEARPVPFDFIGADFKTLEVGRKDEGLEWLSPRESRDLSGGARSLWRPIDSAYALQSEKVTSEISET